MLNDDQIEMLKAPLSRDAVKTREQGGRTLSYIEGWHAIAEANRIFGFGGWSSETVEVKCVAEKERLVGKQADPGFGVTYIARVRIEVRTGEHEYTQREGVGTGHGIDRDLGQAHESAIKEAETDARKRALMTFGNQFGLALYDKTQANVVDEADVSRQRFIDECVASIIRLGQHPDPKDLLLWWNSDIEKKKRRDFDLTAPQVLMLKHLVTEAAKR